MCNELTKEKDKLEVDKKHVRQDLGKLRMEIQGNVHAMKTLQETMEKLKKRKRKKRHQPCPMISQLTENVSTSYVTVSTKIIM